MTTRNQNLQPYRNMYFSGMVEIFYKRYQLPLIGRKNVLYIVREDENYDNTPIGYLYLNDQYQVVMKDSNTTLQVDLNNKSNVGHTHSVMEISDFLTLGVNELKGLNFAIKDDTLIGLDNVWSSQKVENELNANRFKVSQITDIKNIAITGSYNDLIDKPLKVTQMSDGFMSKEDKTKLDAIGIGANVKTVNGKSGDVVLNPSDIGASNEQHTHLGAEITSPVNESIDSQNLGGFKADRYYRNTSITGGFSTFSGDVTNPTIITHTMINPYVVITPNGNPSTVGYYWFEYDELNQNTIKVFNDGVGQTSFQYILIENKN